MENLFRKKRIKNVLRIMEKIAANVISVCKAIAAIKWFIDFIEKFFS